MQNEYKNLQDLLDSYEPEVPQQVWAGVEAGVRQKGGRKALGWWYYGLSIAASVAILLGLVWMLAAGEQQKALPTQALQANVQTPEQQVITSPTHISLPDEQAERTASSTQRPVLAQVQPAQSATVAEVRADSGKTTQNATPSPAQSAPTEATAVAAIMPQPQTQPASAPPQPTFSAPKQPVTVTVAAAPQPSRKREIDINRVSFSDVLSFVGNRLNEAFDSPFTSFTETRDNRTVRTYELRLGKNVSIKRKQHLSSK